MNFKQNFKILRKSIIFMFSNLIIASCKKNYEWQINSFFITPKKSNNDIVYQYNNVVYIRNNQNYFLSYLILKIVILYAESLFLKRGCVKIIIDGS